MDITQEREQELVELVKEVRYEKITEFAKSMYYVLSFGEPLTNANKRADLFVKYWKGQKVSKITK